MTHLLPDLLKLGQWEVATEENGQPVHFLWSDLWRMEYTTILASWIEFDIYVQRAYSFTCAADIKWPALFHWLLNLELPSKGQSQNKAKRDWDINSISGLLIQGFSKRWTQGCVKMRWISCVLLPAEGKQKATLSPNFTQRGAHIFEHPWAL